MSRDSGRATPSDKARLLIVDDDPDLCGTLSDYLSELGFVVRTAGDGQEMRRALQQASIDLVILDLKLPGEDGFTLATYLRRTTSAGIIMLTGSGDKVDEIVGLELGADDYIAKPVALRHLAARVRAVLRRTAGAAAAGDELEADRVYEFDGWTLNLERRNLTAPTGAEVRLTTAEFELLAAFAAHPGRPLSRDRLLELLHGREWSPYDRSIDNLISRLRQKLGEDPRQPALIKSVRGVGYVFASSVNRRR